MMGSVSRVVWMVVLLSCSGSTSKIDVAPLSKALDGTPRPQVQGFATALQSQLTATELSHLEAIDWSQVNPDAFLGDPVIQHAFQILGGYPQPHLRRSRQRRKNAQRPLMRSPRVRRKSATPIKKTVFATALCAAVTSETGIGPLLCVAGGVVVIAAT